MNIYDKKQRKRLHALILFNTTWSGLLWFDLAKIRKNRLSSKRTIEKINAMPCFY